MDGSSARETLVYEMRGRGAVLMFEEVSMGMEGEYRSSYREQGLMTAEGDQSAKLARRAKY